MRRLVKFATPFLLLAGLALLAAAGSVQAQEQTPPPEEQIPADEDIVQGALLYDSWFAALGVLPPEGNMPVWSRQSTNTRSGPDSWRCAECHGWDYRGAQGAYGAGSHYTGFPDLMPLAASLSIDEIVAHLQGANDPAHDFSGYLDDQALVQLATFLKYSLIDDTLYINPVSLQVIGGDMDHGQALYESTCAACHADDGKGILFRTEGVNEYLGSLALRDPWRFLHRTRFGTAGTSMPIGYALGWTPADGRDILAYAQTLPTGGEIVLGEQFAPPAPEPMPVPGGPAENFLEGVLTGIGVFAAALSYAILFLGGFLVLGFLVVILLGRRK
ncbi:MAG: c-type cytochrome [Anaerolineales bacterium]|nr:c-type cytochrome [Anaerolineales bacterium]